MTKLARAVSLMEKQCQVVKKFLSKKKQEVRIISSYFHDLEEDGFHNLFKNISDPRESLVSESNVKKVILNFCGKELGDKTHPLEKQLDALNDNKSEDRTELSDSDVKKLVNNSRITQN